MDGYIDLLLGWQNDCPRNLGIYDQNFGTAGALWRNRHQERGVEVHRRDYVLDL